LSTTSKLLRAAYQLDRASRAVKHPARFAKNRAKSRALKSVGFWKVWRGFWRA
jgi:hypothetical protein